MGLQAEKLAYAFGDPHPPGFDMNAVLGGKGKSLAVMTADLGLPVPAGFTITTAACRLFMAEGWSTSHEAALREGVAQLEKKTGRPFGASNNALLVSVRSGSSVSMPGMMDTVLNVGLCKSRDGALIQFADKPRFAADCRQRLEQTFSKAVGDVALPEDPFLQLRAAVEAVFHSWNGDRAKVYRRIENIDDRMGTAVTVQTMVYGNLDKKSGTGVVFSRDPSTGERRLYGDFLFNAQGEDVVSGTEKTLDVERLAERDPQIAAELSRIVDKLERHSRDLVEIEFTIESGVLWILQFRIGKRSPIAAIKIAHDMALDENFPLTREEAVARTANQIDKICTSRPACNPGRPFAKGLPASPGFVSGALVVNSQAAVEAHDRGRAVILARPETSPSDVEGISAAAGILTARGGLASHAAVVARGWGKPAVVGCEAMIVADDAIRFGDRIVRAGENISIDGATGDVFYGAFDLVEDRPPEVWAILEWRDAAAQQKESSPDQGVPLSDDALVDLLYVKTYCSAEYLADIMSISKASVGETIARLSAAIDAANPRFLRLTATGTAQAAERLTQHRAAFGTDKALSLLHAFEPYNLALKKQVTDWQTKIVGGTQNPNDHTDSQYDLNVIAQVRETHRKTAAWLSSSDLPGSLSIYRLRLDRAMTRVIGGDHAYLVSPRVDSYHNVWFELHEYLIRLAGRTRELERA